MTGVLSFSEANAQFMTVYSNPSSLLTTQTYSRFATLQDTLHSKSVRLVSTLDVRTAQSNGTLTFVVPGTTDTVRIEATLITDDTSGFSWAGRLTNRPGYAAFVTKNNKKSGFIQVSNRFYELIPLTDNYQAFIERNNSNSPGCGNSSEDGNSLPPGPTICRDTTTYNTCPAVITVLVIVTPEAKTWADQHYGSVNTLMQLAQIVNNMAFSNSDIPNKEIHIKWIEKGGFPFSIPLDASSIEKDLGELTTWSFDDRISQSADFVVLLTKHGYDYFNAGGIATIDEFSPNFNNSYSIVEVPYTISIYALAHELGHLFGCRHSWSHYLGNDNTGVCAHGYRYLPVNEELPKQIVQNIDSWHTLMSYGLQFPINTIYELPSNSGNTYAFTIQSDMRILNYSNPSVLFAGNPTGLDDNNQYPSNNAKQIRNTGCDVSAYLEDTDLQFTINTPNCNAPVVFSANIVSPPTGTPGYGPYTVSWYWNQTVFFNSNNLQLLGTRQTITLLEHPSCPTYWIKCIIISADGVVVSRIQKIQMPNGCLCIERSPGITIQNDQNALVDPMVYPNPVSNDLLLIRYKTNDDPVLWVYVFDADGRRMYSGIAQQVEQGLFQLNTQGLSNGLYALQLVSTYGTKSLKFIIQNSK